LLFKFDLAIDLFFDICIIVANLGSKKGRGERVMDTEAVEQLVKILKKVGSEIVNEAIARASRELVEEDSDDASNQTHGEAFDRQAQWLIGRGYPEAAGMNNDQFMRYLNPLRGLFQGGDVIVVPERIVPIPKQMSMVALDGKPGYMYEYLDLGQLRNADGVTTPNVPYLIRDVERGSAMQNTSPDDCVKRFREQGRHGLVIEEGIAVITHGPEILQDHYMDLPGSRYDSVSVPILWLRGGRPKLNYRWAGGADRRWGSASCGSRLGPGS
jgi:hypothetical protein